MTFTTNISSPRREFRTAWLLLLLPPLLATIVEFYGDRAARSWMIAPASLALSVALIGTFVVLIWVSNHGSRRSLRRLTKEFQPLLPGALLAVVPSGLFNLNGPSELALLPYCLGCAVLGATTLGIEYDKNTLGAWLMQPLTRLHLYREKLLVLGLLLGFATIQFLLGLRADFGDVLIVVLVAPVLAWTTGPLLTLLLRSTLAATVFTLIGPAVLAALGILTMSVWFHWRHPGEPMPTALPGYHEFLGVAGAIYVVGAAFWGWWCFRRLEVLDGAAMPSRPGLYGITSPLDNWLTAILPKGATSSLIRKELRLHVVPWFMAGTTFGFWLIWRLVIRYVEDAKNMGEELDHLALGLAGILGATTLLIAGSECVAEEHLLGTLDGQLILPVRVRHQWFLKVAATLFIGILLGLIWPSFLLWLGISDRLYLPIGAWPSILSGAVLILSLGILASSLSRTSIEAVVGFFGLLALSGVIWILIIVFWTLTLGQTTAIVSSDVPLLEFWSQAPDYPTTTGTRAEIFMLTYLWVAPALLLGLCSVLALVLAGINYRAGSSAPQRIWRSVLLLWGGGALFLLVVVGPILLYAWCRR